MQYHKKYIHKHIIAVFITFFVVRNFSDTWKKTNSKNQFLYVNNKNTSHPTPAPIMFPSGCSVPTYFQQDTSGQIFLHLGPYKTGSTSIQSFFETYDPLLQERNISFYGKGIISNFTSKGFRMDVNKLKVVKSRLEKDVAQKKHTVFMSDEEFHLQKYIVKLFQNLPQTTTIHPMIVYRHYFERVLSSYKYHFRPESSNWRKCDDFDFPSFDSFVEKKLSHPPFTLQIMKTFEKLLTDLTQRKTCFFILNMHDENNSLIEQVLKVMFDAGEDIILHEKASHFKHENVGLSALDKIDAARLFMVFWKRKLIGGDISDPKSIILKLVEPLQKIRITAKHFHMWECPNAVILEKMWGFTKDLISVLGMKQNLLILRKEFDLFIEKKKFCNLNVTFLGNDPLYSFDILRNAQINFDVV